MFKTFCVSVYGISGQGVETAVKTLAKAFASSGLNVQSLFFPAYEKRGAFIWGQVKADKAYIESKQIEKDDLCIVLDSSIGLKEIIESTKESGSIIINTSQKINTQVMKKRKIKAFSLDATSLALVASQKKPMPNLAMLGALVKVSGKTTLKAIKSSLDVPENPSLEEGFKNVKMVK